MSADVEYPSFKLLKFGKQMPEDGYLSSFGMTVRQQDRDEHLGIEVLFIVQDQEDSFFMTYLDPTSLTTDHASYHAVSTSF